MNSVVYRAARCLFNVHAEHRILSLARGCPRLLVSRSTSTAKRDEKPSDEVPEQDKEPPASPEKTQVEVKATEEIAKLNEALQEMKDKYQRSLAENENVRTRLRKEISDAKIYAIQGFCKDLLDIADVLDKAVHSLPREILDATDTLHHKNWMDFFEGISATQKELLHVFQRHGLEPFKPTKGDKFDPKFHEAMFQAPVPDMESGLVAHVQSTGYTLHERTLRPAQVGVSK